MRVMAKSVWEGLGRDFQQNSIIISKRLYECTNISAQNNVLRQGQTEPRTSELKKSNESSF